MHDSHTHTHTHIWRTSCADSGAGSKGVNGQTIQTQIHTNCSTKCDFICLASTKGKILLILSIKHFINIRRREEMSGERRQNHLTKVLCTFSQIAIENVPECWEGKRGPMRGMPNWNCWHYIEARAACERTAYYGTFRIPSPVSFAVLLIFYDSHTYLTQSSVQNGL